jgi:predicted short-subunit dehydrogenase-like oxidoreductase (DUF2520 family)
MMKKNKVSIVGAGKLAWNLVPALQAAGQEICQLIARSPGRGEEMAQAYGLNRVDGQLSDLAPEAELVFLAVGDKAIAAVASQLAEVAQPGQLFVHSSGSVPLDALAPLPQRGVFYPMQIFTLSSQADFKPIPLFLEGDERVIKRLRPLAERLSDRVQLLDSEGRLKLHLGAVLVCNFPNYLYRLAQDLVPEAGIQAFEPLIKETLAKVFAQGPENTQTGPAIRGDLNTLYRHLEILQDDPRQRELYWLLSTLINPDLQA